MSNYAIKEDALDINLEIANAIKNMHTKNKPIGSLCITPVIMAKVLGNVELTIGQDEITANHVKALGAIHKNTTYGEIVIDKNNKLVTAPCYMLDAKITDIAAETDLVVKAIIDLTG